MKTTGERGPVYGVGLIDSLPISGQTGSLSQAMPSLDDLEWVRMTAGAAQGQRTVAGYEVLLSHFRRQRGALAALHEWFLEKAPEHYRGCGLYLDVCAMLDLTPDKSDGPAKPST